MTVALGIILSNFILRRFLQWEVGYDYVNIWLYILIPLQAIAISLRILVGKSYSLFVPAIVGLVTFITMRPIHEEHNLWSSVGNLNAIHVFSGLYIGIAIMNMFLLFIKPESGKSCPTSRS